jgi:predicted RNA-binding Zn-ribbon protein involved in translation (DUF1610 family)
MSDTLFDPGPPICWKCRGRKVILNRAGTEIPCPECGAKKGMRQTEEATDATEEWRLKAEAVVRSTARARETYTMDHVMATFTNVYPNLHTHGARDEKRRWGPLMRRLAGEGVHVNTGEYVRSERRHSSPIPIWRSLLWNGSERQSNENSVD